MSHRPRLGVQRFAMRRSPPRAERLSLHDRDLSLWRHPGSGPTVLFLHGFLDSGRSYDAVIDALDFPVDAIAVDWRGHGRARPLPRGSSAHLLDHLKDLSALVDHLAATAALPDAVVAHSMGGNVALLLAGTRPDVVKRLMLLDALGAPPEEPENQVDRLRRLLEYPQPKRPFKTVATREEGIQRIRQSAPHLTDAGAQRMIAHNLEPMDDGGFQFVFDPQLRGPTPTRWPEAFWQKLCSNVSAPTIVVRAEHGFIPEGDLAASRFSALQRGTWVDVEGTGHHLHVDQPVRIAALLEELLQQPTTP